MEKSEDKYKVFNEWCKQQGIIMPKLEYPVEFENGVLGSKFTEDIEPREVFLYVP